MKRISVHTLVILILIGLAIILLEQLTRYPNATHHYIYITLQPTWTRIPTSTSTPTPSPTEWATDTATPTVDYVALGLPSPTATPTMDYAELANIYLNTPTPFPTYQIPTPQPTPLDPLTQVTARALPPEWKPTPFQLIEYGESMLDWQVSVIQTATDLMNWVDADPVQFWQQVKSMRPEETWFGAAYEWLLKDDFDGDQKPEWLASIPAYPANKEIRSYPEQVIILFELIDGLYQPVMYHRTFRYGGSLHGYFAKVLLAQDLNKNGLKEIAWRYKTCGSACSDYIQIGEWDGKNWRFVFWESFPATGFTNYFIFADKDSDGIIEITLNYTTLYKYHSRYPEREASDTYGWRNEQWVLLEEWRSPNSDPYAIMHDIYSALEFGKIERAIEFGQPLINNLQNSCGQIETYTGIEVMLAYTMIDKPQTAQAVLQKMDIYCNTPENVFLNAAHVYMQAYNQTNDAVSACSAMNRFVFGAERPLPDLHLYRRFDNGYIFTYCPISPDWR
ncbi:MAG: hypothetical protein HYZ24_04960 [Chloroflexi bacterium]|nr:hypothetical protein [Chloroflexota bacterium]